MKGSVMGSMYFLERAVRRLEHVLHRLAGPVLLRGLHDERVHHVEADVEDDGVALLHVLLVAGEAHLKARSCVFCLPYDTKVNMKRVGAF